MNAPLTGVLTRAGTFPIRDEEVMGFVVSCTREELEAVKHLPMYRRVVIVEAETAVENERLRAAIDEALMHLNTNYDIDGNSMKDSDAATALRRAIEKTDTTP